MWLSSVVRSSSLPSLACFYSLSLQSISKFSLDALALVFFSKALYQNCQRSNISHIYTTQQNRRIKFLMLEYPTALHRCKFYFFFFNYQKRFHKDLHLYWQCRWQCLPYFIYHTICLFSPPVSTLAWSNSSNILFSMVALVTKRELSVQQRSPCLTQRQV